MSHFSVIVTGTDIGQQLAPYAEYECTGCDPKYIVNLDETAEKRADYESSTTSIYTLPDGTVLDGSDPLLYREVTQEDHQRYGFGGLLLGTGWANGAHWVSRHWDDFGYRAKMLAPDRVGAVHSKRPISECMSFAEYCIDYCGGTPLGLGSEPDLDGDHKFGWVAVDLVSGEVVQVVRRTNPNAKWDYWTIGGRYSRYFALAANPHYKADTATIDQIDIDDLAIPYAIVHDGQWLSQGEMGWWGMSNDELTEEEWEAKVREFLRSLPASTRLTIVDCHI